MEIEKTNKTGMLKRFLSFALCCVMVFSCVPIEVFADAGGYCGEDLTWTLADDGVLTIFGSGQMRDYVYNDAPWFGSRATITSVVIQEGVTSIGSGAFFGCSSLSSISLPAGVASIGDAAFSGCSSLSSISLPAGVTSIGEHTFYGCSSLRSISLPAGVASIGDYAFSDCRKLACVTFTGAAPSICDSAFNRVTATVLYPGNDAAWTTDKRLDYRGKLTWTSSAEHVHDHTPEITAPTCTEQGYTAYACFCGDYYVGDYVNALGHQEITVPGTPATCSASGVTDGKACSVCGVITVEGEIIDALGHTEEIIPGRAATCTRTGLTGGKQCSVCGETLEEQQIIPLAAHQEETISARAATCTRTGLTRGKQCSVCGEILEEQKIISSGGHTEEIIPGKAATCTQSGLTAGKKCSVCGEVLVTQKIIIAAGHSYEEVGLKRATRTEVGYRAHYECRDCGRWATDASGQTETSKWACRIPAVTTVRLSSTRYNYNGKVRTPAVGVYDSTGSKLVKGIDYTVTYAKGRKNVGQYNVTMKGIGDYDFRTTLTFRIVPPKTKITSLTGRTKSFAISWTRKTTQVTGYQIQVSLDKSFETSVKTMTVKGSTATSGTVKNLKSQKSYYVRIRTYKTVSGKNYYSSWSDAMRVKTK